MKERAVILLVDDREDDRELTKVILRERLPGARLLVATDVFSVAELIGQEQCDGAVIEADLAWCPATELVARIRRHNKDCLIVFYSREGIRTLTPEIADLGLSAFYPKDARHLLEIPRLFARRLEVTTPVDEKIAAEPEAAIPAAAVTDGTARQGDPPQADFQAEMFYAISHDLRQPLQLFNRQVRLLDRRYREKLDSAGGELIENMARLAEHMDLLLDSILSYYRLESAGDGEEQLPVADGVAAVVATFGPELEEVGGQVMVGDLPPFLVGRGRMTRLFQNLIGNAIKFRGARPPVVEISALDVTDHWMFTVADNGIGIDQDRVDQIFAIFKRLHSQDKYPGSGIGLALCKRIVEQLGGKIWARSKPGEGTAIHFTLPKHNHTIRDRAGGAGEPGNEHSDKGTAGRG